MATTIRARYAGTCGSCGQRFPKGTAITATGRGTWAHVNCLMRERSVKAAYSPTMPSDTDLLSWASEAFGPENLWADGERDYRAAVGWARAQWLRAQADWQAELDGTHEASRRSDERDQRALEAMMEYEMGANR